MGSYEPQQTLQPRRFVAFRALKYHPWVVPGLALRRVVLYAAISAMLIAASTFLILYASSVCFLGRSIGISYELADAPCARTASLRVYRWLQMQRPELRQAEARFRVDRRAIAGAIAYEALDNIFLSPVFGLTRSAGPGRYIIKRTILEKAIRQQNKLKTAVFCHGRR
jgi:hypothetical protein